MSFSGSMKVTKGLDASAVEAAVDELTVTGNDDAPVEREDAVSAACGAAADIINSGAVGNPSEFGFAVNVSGHVNPGHNPTPGADYLNVSITQMLES